MCSAALLWRSVSMIILGTQNLEPNALSDWSRLPASCRRDWASVILSCSLSLWLRFMGSNTRLVFELCHIEISHLICCTLKTFAFFPSPKLWLFCVNDGVGMNMPARAIINFSLTVKGTVLLILLQPGCSKSDTIPFQTWLYNTHFQMLVFSLSSYYSNDAFRILWMSRYTRSNSPIQLLPV